MSDEKTAALPQHIQEFNTIVGLAFAQLYEAFPEQKALDRDVIAKKMETSANLPSG